MANKDYLVPHSLLEFQNEKKMTDEEMLLFYLNMVYLLDQNEQMNLYRLFSLSFMTEKARILELQRVAVQRSLPK